MSDTRSARVRRRLSHPVVDADGHWVEAQSVFQEYLGEVAGPGMVDKYRKNGAGGSLQGQGWYDLTPQERARRRMTRAAWWGHPANADARSAAMMPALFYEHLDDWGIDYAIVYPTMGLLLPNARDDDLRQALTRAYNTMASDLFRPFADRMTPAGLCALNTPAAAIEEAEYAVKVLGLKVLVMNGAVPRAMTADADWQPDPARRRVYIDCLALDSPYDYEPVWAKFAALKVAVTDHSLSNGWPDRNSPTNYVANHIGHFAQSHHAFARALFLGGVTERHPGLNFGFLEGGVGWACSLYADLFGHWNTRSKRSMDKYLKPTNIDQDEMRRLMTRHAKGTRFEGKIDEILAHNLGGASQSVSAEDATRRDIDCDDFAAVKIDGPDDIRRLFARNFYFGCEADDPITAWAFDTKVNTCIKPVLGSDISHFDVIDPSAVLEEAWELVEHGLISDENFRDFTFGNVVEMHGGMNPDFFRGTRVQDEAARELRRRTQTNAKAPG